MPSQKEQNQDHLVELEGVMVLHLLANGVLAHLPLELGNAASHQRS